MIKYKIDLVFQKDKSGCVIASAAMLAGITYDDAKKVVIDLYDEEQVDYGYSTRQTLELMKKLGCRVTMPRFTELYHDQIYMIAVPSINIHKGTHVMVVDTRFDDYNDFRIYDPSQKKRYGKRWGSFHGIKSWSYPIRLISRGRNNAV